MFKNEENLEKTSNSSNNINKSKIGKCVYDCTETFQNKLLTSVIESNLLNKNQLEELNKVIIQECYSFRDWMTSAVFRNLE